MDINIDYFVQITFVLLILSMITEKVTEFVKQNIHDNKLKRFLNPTPKLKPTATLEDFEEREKNKYGREIQTLSIFIGVIISFSCRANLFNIYNPEFELGWINIDWNKYGFWNGVSDFFGCGFTALFLSLGSKFFHDLLGVLLATKNLKRKLKDRDGVENLHTIEEVDAYIAEVEPAVVEAQLEEHLKSIPEVLNYEYSDSDSTADVFIGPMSDDDLGKLERFISVKLANKKMRGIELNYIQF